MADAVAFAESYPPEVRSGIVQALLSSSVPGTGADSEGAAIPAGEAVSVAQRQTGIRAVAESAGVSVAVLERFIQVADDGTVTIRARLGGDAVADRQNAYSAVLAYVREKALGEMDTESALVRAVCKEHRCNDGNLTTNLKKRGWLLEHGAKGRHKSYRLSPSGGRGRARSDRFSVSSDLSGAARQIVSTSSVDQAGVLGAVPSGLRDSSCTRIQQDPSEFQGAPLGTRRTKRRQALRNRVFDPQRPRCRCVSRGPVKASEHVRRVQGAGARERSAFHSDPNSSNAHCALRDS